ncbi:MAG: hypothetical protein N3G78_00700 [Desulfobacterota bacterium]|nr:hypothetical protein [Thermodesulfobacteriota bacterium]
MKQAVFPSPFKTKLTYWLAKWEETITFLTLLFGVLAIGSGIAWLFLQERPLLYGLMGFSAIYFAGRRAWKAPQTLL